MASHAINQTQDQLTEFNLAQHNILLQKSQSQSSSQRNQTDNQKLSSVIPWVEKVLSREEDRSHRYYHHAKSPIDRTPTQAQAQSLPLLLKSHSHSHSPSPNIVDVDLHLNQEMEIAQLEEQLARAGNSMGTGLDCLAADLEALELFHESPGKKGMGNGNGNGNGKGCAESSLERFVLPERCGPPS